MKEAILNILNQDESKYLSIMQNTRQPNIVVERWQVWTELRKQDYSMKAIASHFGLRSHSTVWHGLKRIANKDTKQPITATLLRELYKSIPKENKGLIIEALNLRGYSCSEIGDWYNMTRNAVYYLMVKETSQRDFEERRKKIVKF